MPITNAAASVGRVRDQRLLLRRGGADWGGYEDHISFMGTVLTFPVEGYVPKMGRDPMKGLGRI
ncbi:MAG: hypothetical protein JO337_00215 [Acidimicrobiales bacterium]|nr:hypothetical protein [Acidimicrobiales bacterium]